MFGYQTLACVIVEQNDTLRTRAMRTWTGKRFTRQSIGGMFWSIQSLFRLASTASFLTLWNLFRVVSCRRACLLCVFTRWSDCQTFGCLWKDWRRQYPVCVEQDRRSDWWLFSYQLWKDQTKSQDQCNIDSSSKRRLYRWGCPGWRSRHNIIRGNNAVPVRSSWNDSANLYQLWKLRLQGNKLYWYKWACLDSRWWVFQRGSK